MDSLVHFSDIGWPSTEAITRVVREWEPDPTLFIGASLLPLNTQDFNESPSSISLGHPGPVARHHPCHYAGR